MKKILKISSFAVLSLAAFSCAGENDITNDLKQNDVSSSEKKQFSKTSLGPNDDVRQDGAFIRNYDNGYLYIKFEGKLRHIASLQTFHGLFDNDNIFIFETNTQNLLYNTNATMGESLAPDNELINHISTGKIYLRENNTIRHIPTMAILNRYRFRLSTVRNVTSISNYTTLPDLTITY